MKFSFVPREELFFDLLDRTAQYLVEGAKAYEELACDFTAVEEKIARISSLEHACDEVCHLTLEKLETTFITPLDREDIHELTVRLDDVIDMTTVSASRLWMFRATESRPAIRQMARTLVQQTLLLKSAVARLRTPRERALARNECIEVHRLENEADETLKNAMRELFDQEKDAINLIRWKDIYQTLEIATDRAEDAANVIQGIVVKNA